MFRATMCPSSEEITVYMRHLVLVTLCGWLSGMQGGIHSNLHTRQSWWWTHSRPKHVEKGNKYTKKNCAPSWLYLQDYIGMQSQQNIKFYIALVSWLHVSVSTKPSSGQC